MCVTDLRWAEQGPIGTVAWMPDEPTTGEIMRRLERFESRMDARINDLVAANVYDRDYKHLEARISAVEEGLRWFRRQVLAAVIPAVVSAIVVILSVTG